LFASFPPASVKQYARASNRSQPEGCEWNTSSGVPTTCVGDICHKLQSLRSYALRCRLVTDELSSGWPVIRKLTARLIGQLNRHPRRTLAPTVPPKFGSGKFAPDNCSDLYPSDCQHVLSKLGPLSTDNANSQVVFQLAQLPPRIRRAKCVILWLAKPCGSPAHKQMFSVRVRSGELSKVSRIDRGIPPKYSPGRRSTLCGRSVPKDMQGAETESTRHLQPSSSRKEMTPVSS
jgi:hypothetical protein